MTVYNSNLWLCPFSSSNTVSYWSLRINSHYQQLTIAPNWVIASFSSRLLETESTTFLKVLLMVLLSPVELLGRKNLSSNLPAQLLLLLFQRLFSYFLLLRSVKVYSRSVLCSHIIPLSHTKIQMSQLLSSYHSWKVEISTQASLLNYLIFKSSCIRIDWTKERRELQKQKHA